MSKIPKRPEKVIGLGTFQTVDDLVRHEHAVAARAVEALRRFNGHLTGCATDDGLDCDCGYTEAAAAIVEIDASGWQQ